MTILEHLQSEKLEATRARDRLKARAALLHHREEHAYGEEAMWAAKRYEVRARFLGEEIEEMEARDVAL